MPRRWINNLDALATTPARRQALQVVEAGLDAIDTEQAIRSSVSLEGETLSIGDMAVDLVRFKRIRIVGFGKASCTAAVALEQMLGLRIKDGVVIDVVSAKCEFIKTFVGTHPRPSDENVLAARDIIAMAQEVSEDDLVLVIISGGGSALLCWPQSECDQGQQLYDEFLKVGGTITELNTVRRHISSLKGGGLAKLFYPAKVIGLIFCDVPGNQCEQVASGPTFRDDSTVDDAKNILDKYGITGFELMETPKDERFFKNVTNIMLVSNTMALDAMVEKGKALGFSPVILSSALYDAPSQVIEKMMKELDRHDMVLAGGEPTIIVEGEQGSGGRNTYLAMCVLSHLQENMVFASVGSDGLDNSDAAGGIVDAQTMVRARELGLDFDAHLKRFDSYGFLQKTGDLLFTGPTGANVSDLLLLMRLPAGRQAGNESR